MPKCWLLLLLYYSTQYYSTTVQYKYYSCARPLLYSINLTNNIECCLEPIQKNLRGLTPPTDNDTTELIKHGLKLTNRFLDYTDHAPRTRSSEAHTGAYLSSGARTSMGGAQTQSKYYIGF